MIVIFDFLIIFQFLAVGSTMMVNQEFIKLTHMVNSTLISSKICSLKLTCLSFCAEEDTCTMVTISLKSLKNAKQAYLCRRYQVIGHNKISSQNDMEIWYKDDGQVEPTNHQTACPSGFTELDTGCYSDDIPGEMTWNASKNYCENIVPGSHLAIFESLEVFT